METGTPILMPTDVHADSVSVTCHSRKQLNIEDCEIAKYNVPWMFGILCCISLGLLLDLVMYRSSQLAFGSRRQIRILEDSALPSSSDPAPS